MYQNQKQNFIVSKRQFPLICLKNLDISTIDKNCIVNDFCDCVSIPLTPQSNEVPAYDQIFDSLVLKYVKQNGRNDVFSIQSKTLNLIVDDNDGERKYYISSMINIQDDDPVCEQLEIILTDQEMVLIESMLKEEYCITQKGA